MSWRPITIDDVRLTPAEKAAMSNIQGAEITGGDLLLVVVREFASACAAGGYAIATDDTVSDLCRPHVINRARWLWLAEFPALKAFQTADRSALNAKAEKFLSDVANGRQNIDAPASAPAPVKAASATVPDKVKGRMGI